jgi:outer membrane protein OmpU
MKKLLLLSTALVGVTMMSAPASAAVKLNTGGYIDAYAAWADNNEAAGAANSLRTFNWRRDSELFFAGSTTLDNGLTVGINYELDLGQAVQTNEVYTYFSGGWGRVNIGAEDGAAYLLQVNAPSADSNVDGMQVTVQAVNSIDDVFSNLTGAQGTTGLPGLPNMGTLDYNHLSSPTDGALQARDRITYLTPKFNGFQAGVSFAPQDGQAAVGADVAPMALDQVAGTYDNVWEGSARWDGEFQGFGIALGGGYSHAALQSDVGLTNAFAGSSVVVIGGNSTTAAPVVSDGLTQWNAGLNLAWSGFSLGGAYRRAETENHNGVDLGSTANTIDLVDTMDVTQNTWALGLGYDNGPWHVGTSYWRQDTERDASGSLAADDGALAAVDAEAHRYTVGGGYTFGPGMTFRGAVAWGEFDNSTGSSNGAQVDKAGFDTVGFLGAAATNNDFTQVTIGTDIQF